MSSPEPSLLLVVLTGGLGVASGYFLRIVQKLEDRRDNIHLKILPALYYNILSFEESTNIFISDPNPNSSEFLARIVEIHTNLKNLIASGDVLLAKVDLKRLLKFHWDLELFRIQLDQIKNNQSRVDEVVSAFSRGNSAYPWLKVDPRQILRDAKVITNEINTKVKGYRSSLIWLIIMFFAQGAVVAFIEYLNTLHE